MYPGRYNASFLFGLTLGVPFLQIVRYNWNKKEKLAYLFTNFVYLIK